jgi:adenylate cyclase
MPATPGTILLVDDDEFFRSVTADMLATHGYRVRALADPVEGVAAAEAEQPDLILLDMLMPRMDGLETLQVLKQQPRTASIPVLMITVEPSEQIMIKALGLGAENLLVKPVSHEELLIRVEHAMRRKRRLDELSGVIRRHLDPSVAYQILQQPGQALSMRRAHLAVLFSDLRGFTSVAERIQPEQVAEMLNSLFEVLVGCVLRYGGVLDKFLGDGLMALFGAPIDYPDNESRAVCAALDMLRELQTLDTEFERHVQEPIHLGIGINAGEAVVGPVGSRVRMNYTAIGDAVNVAARLTAQARGREIIISESVRAKLEPTFRVVELAPTLLKGKSHPLRIYRVLPDQELNVLIRRKT